MAAFQKFNCFTLDLGTGVHDLSADALAFVLTNVAPTLTNTKLADLTEITAEHGYSAGGVALTSVAFTQTSGVAKLTAANAVCTASGGTIGPFRYAVLYNATPTDKNLIGWWDNGNAVTLADGEKFTLSFDTTAGILTVG